MASVASQLIEEVTAHAQSDSLEDAREICADGTYFPNNLRIHRVSQEECARLRESVPSVNVYQFNPKHLYPKLNGYGDNGQRKVGASCGSKYCNLQS